MLYCLAEMLARSGDSRNAKVEILDRIGARTTAEMLQTAEMPHATSGTTLNYSRNAKDKEKYGVKHPLRPRQTRRWGYAALRGRRKQFRNVLLPPRVHIKPSVTVSTPGISHGEYGTHYNRPSTLLLTTPSVGCLTGSPGSAAYPC